VEENAGELLVNSEVLKIVPYMWLLVRQRRLENPQQKVWLGVWK
jgi:hypothetical protein